MRRLLLAFALFSLAATPACLNGNGGCPLLPTESSVTASSSTDCLSLHIQGTEDGESGRCVDGLTVVGTNGCSAALVLTPPVATDGGSEPAQTFAPGASISFDVDTSRGTDGSGQVTWTIPAKLGTTDLTITVVAQES